MYTLYFDGLFRDVENSCTTGIQAGVVCYGWVIEKHNNPVARGHGAKALSKHANANTAEYMALIAGLEALADLRLQLWDQIIIVGDSKTVICQMSGQTQMHNANLRPTYDQAVALANQLPIAQWRWVRRAMNKTADELTRRALFLVQRNPQKYLEMLHSLDPRNASTGKTGQGSGFNLLDLRTYQTAIC